MSDYLDAPVHAAVDDEARAAWVAERPEADRPSAAEMEADDFADWCWWREHAAARPDPWGDDPPKRIERLHTPIPTDPPF